MSGALNQKGFQNWGPHQVMGECFGLVLSGSRGSSVIGSFSQSHLEGKRNEGALTV